MSATASEFGARVEEYRERLGMLQKILAERSGLSPSHLNRIEQGLRNPPQVETVLRMVEALRLTRAEAEEFVQLAGYSPVVLETDGALSYNAPTLPPYTRLHNALAKHPPHIQEQYIDTFITILGIAQQEQATIEDEDNEYGE